MSARNAARRPIYGVAGVTAPPAVAVVGNARRSGQVGRLVAWVLGTEEVTDLRGRRATNHLARVQVPACLMAKPDVVIVFAPTEASDLPAVLCRLARAERSVVVVSERGGADAAAAAHSVGAALVVTRDTVTSRGGCAHRWERDRAVASAIIAALRDDWRPRRLMPLQ